MPSHALPPGSPEARGRRREKRRLGRVGITQALTVLPGPVVGLAFFQNGRQEHASVLYYVASAVVGALVMAATFAAASLSARASAKLVRQRPRWQYGLLGIAYFGPVAGFIRVADAHIQAHTQNETSWAAVAGGLLAMYCGVAGLLMFGRAVSWGRARRAFWLFPPHWVDLLYPMRGAAGNGPPEG